MPTTATPVTFTYDGDIIGAVRDVDVQNNYDTIRFGMPHADPDWIGVDSNGHEHRWIDHQLTDATVVVDETYWCQDCHDEHTRSHWECSICGEKIEPGTHIPRPKRLLISREMTVTVALTGRFQGAWGNLRPAEFTLNAERHTGRAALVEHAGGTLGGETASFRFVPDEDTSNR